MMDFGKLQRLAIFKVAGFICNGDIKKLFLKIGINQNGETLYYLEKLILPLALQSQFFLFDVQLLWSYDYSK